MKPGKLLSKDESTQKISALRKFKMPEPLVGWRWESDNCTSIVELQEKLIRIERSITDNILE